MDDDFEMIPIANALRFKQFIKILGDRLQAPKMSIRVIIDESIPKEPKIIDY